VPAADARDSRDADCRGLFGIRTDDTGCQDPVWGLRRMSLAPHNGFAGTFNIGPMRIALLSDLHLSVQAMPPPSVDADVLSWPVTCIARPVPSNGRANTTCRPCSSPATTSSMALGQHRARVAPARRRELGARARTRCLAARWRALLGVHAVVRLPSVRVAATARAGPAAGQHDGARLLAHPCRA